MSTLVVVRHGQASFFADDYDRLSPLGETQSQRLGAFWAARGETFHQVFTGPRLRQRETARLVGEAMQAAGLDWPEPVVVPGLDEYQAEAVLKHALPRLIEQHPEIAALSAEIAEADSRDEHLRRFQRMYEVIIRRWSRGELDLPEIESWPEFRRRAHAAYDEITAARGRKRVVAFTSGGPVGVAVERALGSPEEKTLELAWMVRNASVSEFLFAGERFTLSSFNALSHLDAPALWSYR